VLPSSQVSGAVMLLFPQMTQALQPSPGLVLPSSHSSPASVMPLPHVAASVVVVVGGRIAVVDVTLVVVVVGAGLPPRVTLQWARALFCGSNCAPLLSTRSAIVQGKSDARAAVPCAQSNWTCATFCGSITLRSGARASARATLSVSRAEKRNAGGRRLVTRWRTLASCPLPGMLTDAG
jgi:hypothetical protein